MPKKLGVGLPYWIQLADQLIVGLENHFNTVTASTEPAVMTIGCDSENVNSSVHIISV